VALVTGGFCGGLDGFVWLFVGVGAGVAAGLAGVPVAGCVVGVLSVPVVPVELDGVAVGAGSWPGIGSGLFRTLAMSSFSPASLPSWRCL
jgi:hypothetical protein